MSGVAGVAYADGDSRAEEAGREANLESNAPREGFVIAGSAGAGLVFGDGEIGRGPGVSLRVGHVATSSTVLTFEITTGSALHGFKDPMTMKTTTYINNTVALLAGAQVYLAPSFWIRIAGGLGGYTIDRPPQSGGRTNYPGLAGCTSLGIDLARWHYLVLGIETVTVGNITDKGLVVTSGLNLGLSYY
jgi:hypothetical protein